MENNFHYAYNAEENQEAMNLRQKYLPQEQTDLQKLKALDAKVKRAPSTFAYIYGSISAIVMGAGMSLVMTDIAEKIGLGDAMFTGIVIGVVGMLMALIYYPIHEAIMSVRKKKYAPEIFALSEKIMKQ